MKINWLILLSFTLIQPFMLHGADNVSASAASSGALTTIAQTPLNEEQIATLAQQAIANCITPQSRKYAKTLQKKLATLLAFRSQLQSESLRDKRAGLIINQQHLNSGYIQADQHDNTFSTSPDANKQSWWQVFKNKLLIKSANQQKEIAWAHETASFLVQYWPTFYKSRKEREQIESFMDNVASDATTDAQPTTIAKVPFAHEQIATLAQQAIANCITPQTCRYEATLQKKLATLLTFRSQLQSESLRDKSARLLIHQQSLNIGCIQADQHDGTASSSSASNTQNWSVLFRNKLLIKSTDKQAEISWAHEIASLFVQYWPTYTAYMAQKHRESAARKREQAYDSVEEIDELLRKNRRHNDSPVPFVPVADEQISVSQTPASTSFDLLMHSNHDALDAVSFSEVDPDSMVYFDPPTPTIEDLFSDKRT